MSNNIDFEFGRSIGATGYCELIELPNRFQFMRNVSGESYEFYLMGEWVIGYNTGIIDLYKPIPPSKPMPKSSFVLTNNYEVTADEVVGIHVQYTDYIHPLSAQEILNVIHSLEKAIIELKKKLEEE